MRLLRTTLPSYKVSSSLSVSRFLPSAMVPLCHLQCSLCANIVDQPVETPCRKLVCSTCVVSLLRSCSIDHFPCPSCKGTHEITVSSFPEATEVVMKVAGELLVTCDRVGCSEVVPLKNLRTHMNSGCTYAFHTFSPSKLTVGQILSRPLTSTPTTAERRAATSVVKRLMGSSPAGQGSCTDVVKLPTAGQVRM